MSIRRPRGIIRTTAAIQSAPPQGKGQLLSPRSEVTYQIFEDAYYEKRVWMPSANLSNYVMIFTSLSLGHKSRLGRLAFRHLLQTLSESEFVPRILVFWNHAVKACVEGSPLLPCLARIERAGVKILVCTFALEKLKLKSKLRSGKLASNIDLLDAIHKAQKVVSF
ncbi:MAG TPA: hypothetical protein PKO06_22345 [Candidatus Ozemobacteraceae bacterium]|nr:hypothetical protein [Candidatus Ozemobacteraceae bacterium]